MEIKNRFAMQRFAFYMRARRFQIDPWLAEKGQMGCF